MWEQDQASKVCSPVIHQGHVYWAWRSMTCLDFETGKVQWQGGQFGDAGSCIVTADDRLIRKFYRLIPGFGYNHV